MAPATPAFLRAQRRADALKALKTGPVIDVTTDDTPPSQAATRPQTLALVTPEHLFIRRGDTFEALGKAPFIDLTDDDSPPGRRGWKRLAVRPTSLTLKSNGVERSYTLRDGRWTDGDKRLNRRVDLRCIVGVVLKPSNGYDASFHLSPDNRGGFTGKYGEDETGRISLGLREMKAMIQQARRKGGFGSLSIWQFRCQPDPLVGWRIVWLTCVVHKQQLYSQSSL
jgi:hypothetical protein